MWIERFIQDFGVRFPLLRRLGEKKMGRDVWLGTKPAITFDKLKMVRAGLRAFRTFKHGYKPTTNLVQLTGVPEHRAVTVNQAEAMDFIQGKDLKLDVKIDPGFVIITYAGFSLGVGRYRDGRIKNQVPRARRVRKGLRGEI